MSGGSQRVGDVEVGHGQVNVLLVILGDWPGSTTLTPDQADEVADQLRAQAANVRRINTDASG